MWGFHIACAVAAAICLLGVLGAARLPGPSQGPGARRTGRAAVPGDAACTL
ncbi:hypothetical protein ACIPQJ_00615 [Streptomyces sp. NPDC090082]|uniref:hypothetical protein n=1 Tax=unclassified Streptomyces TaxID=2593676 RepID=UPI0038282EB7